MSDEDPLIDLIPAYALGALDRNEAREVEAHLPYCADCRMELERFDALAKELPLALAEADPPESLHTRLLAQAAEKPGVEAAPLGHSVWEQVTAVFRQHKALAFSYAALTVLVLILLGTTIFFWQRVTDLSGGPVPGSLQAVHLTSTGVIPNAEGYLTVSWDGLSGAIVLDRVPQLGDGQVYQLWLVRDGRRDSGALLDVDELEYGGGRVQPPEPLFNYSSVEVTIEPAGGSERPTSEVIMSAPMFP